MLSYFIRRILMLLVAALAIARTATGQNAVPFASMETEAWLSYGRLDPKAINNYSHLPTSIVVLGSSPVLESARQEMIRGFDQMLGMKLDRQSTIGANDLILATTDGLKGQIPALKYPRTLDKDSYLIVWIRVHNAESLLVTALNERGVLYGAFALLSKIARGESLAGLEEEQSPYAPIRWVNQWDNLDGRIERGYGGPSIFFEGGKVRDDLTRAGEYARLLASIGINGCTINNVNAAPAALEDSFIAQVKRIADAFRPWGVQLSMAADLSTPKIVGGLDTFDPLDPRVAEWWRKKVDEIYRQIPDFGGFVVKADSEGRSGPSAYGRTHADAANVIARALKPHGGVVFYRAFVYNHHLDWHDLKNDRARAAYDNFHPLDGAFDDNAVIQIKNGPIDFQVREPVSPLIAGLRRTNQAIELQVTQEYTGQQKHLCFLVPMWKETLDFDMRVDDKPSTVKDLVSGEVFRRPLGGFSGVANVGMDASWLGSPLAMANLYGFGRLAWDPNLSSQAIVDEWTRLTYGSDPVLAGTIEKLQLSSWHVYESYTGPLGVGTLTNITGNHYDPAPESSEENGWGQWHRADHRGIGMDRTIATGTGYIGQYPPEVQRLYEPLSACPEELLLFFHHVPYTHVLRLGKTVVQHVYDSHYEGAAKAHEFITQWKAVEGHIDEARYRDILARFEFQADEADKWRDTISAWIYRMSGIPDQEGRIGKRASAQGSTRSGSPRY
jgi:alpha-glucuronidase